MTHGARRISIGLSLLALAGLLGACEVSHRSTHTSAAPAVASEPEVGATTSVPRVDSAAVALAESLEVADRAIAKGRSAYLETCAMCHGPYGRGDGPLALDLRRRGGRRPTRLDDPARVDSLTHDRVVAAILAGRAHAARTPLMPPWAEIADSDLAAAIADFVPRLASLDSISRAAIQQRLARPAGAPEQGRVLYALECASCHGPEGRGDGLLADALQASHGAHPRDLTDRAYFARRTDAQIAAALELGGGHTGRSLYMPAWNYSYSADRIRDLVATVRALSGTPPHAAACRDPRRARSRASGELAMTR